jgi:hypothetical protein
MPLRAYLMAIAIFANEVKGKSMLAMSRDLGTSYKTSFVLAHKIREAMAAEVSQNAIGGEGKKAEIDAGMVRRLREAGEPQRGSQRPAPAPNQSGKRKAVVIIRERGGKTLPGVFRNEADALTFIRQRVAPKTTLYADEAAGWNALSARYTLHRINHRKPIASATSAQTHTNNAEGFFSRMRRGEIGHHHHVAGPYLTGSLRRRRGGKITSAIANGSQVNKIVTLAMLNKPISIDFCGYWQRGARTPGLPVSA